MTTHHIGRIVVGCLTAGLVVALALVVGPVAGAQEHVITGTVLLAFASSWALLATLSILWTTQPQRWAAMPAGFMGWPARVFWCSRRAARSSTRSGGSGRRSCLCCSRGRSFASDAICTVARGRWVVYPLLAVYALVRGRRRLSDHPRVARPAPHPAPGQLIDVGGHRLHLSCVGSGSPTVILESGLGETGASTGDGSRPRSRATQECASTTAPVEGWSDAAPRRAGRRRRRHGSPRPARSRARCRVRSCSSAIRRGAVRQDLRRPVSRTGRRNGLARRPTCRSVRGSSDLPGLLQLSSAASLRCCRRWLDSASDGCSCSTTTAAAASRAVQRFTTFRRSLRARRRVRRVADRRSRRPVRFRASATGRSSS